jgi:hypothetical protein
MKQRFILPKMIRKRKLAVIALLLVFASHQCGRARGSSSGGDPSPPHAGAGGDGGKSKAFSALKGAVSGYFESEISAAAQQLNRTREEVEGQLRSELSQAQKTITDLKHAVFDPEVQTFLDNWLGGKKALTMPIVQLRATLDQNPRLLKAIRQSGVEGRLGPAAARVLERNLSPLALKAIKLARGVTVEIALDIMDRCAGQEETMTEMVRFCNDADVVVKNIIDTRAMAYLVPPEYYTVILSLVNNKILPRLLMPTFTAVLVGLDPRSDDMLLGALIACYATMHLTRDKAMELLAFVDDMFMESSLDGAKSRLKSLMDASSTTTESIGRESLEFFKQIVPPEKFSQRVSRNRHLNADEKIVLKMTRLLGLGRHKNKWDSFLWGGRWRISLGDSNAKEKYLKIGKKAGATIREE